MESAIVQMISDDFTKCQNMKKLTKSTAHSIVKISTKKRYHVLTILKSFFSSDTRQSMKRRIATER